ncbi:MAG TPA: efflux RND transporter periplasmic adaptor subunit, partial [Roseateles sp.]|nr:efflux RND transporter periplasmic adaptor subunit [Roseateles sp.]
MRKLHSVVAVVALVGLSALAWWWQKQPAQAAAAAVNSTPGGRSGGPGGPASVEVGRVQALSLADDAQAVGTLRARQSVLLKPEVSGRITKLGFTDGQRVRRGQLLVQLDDALQAAQLQQAEAQEGIARTQLQRNRELLAQSFVSPSVVDQAEATLKVAEAQVALARAQLERLQVRSPFDGVAGIRLVNLGDYVKDGTELISVEDASTMWVDFRLPERFVPQLRLGQDVSMGLDALPGREFKARIEALDAQLDANGRSMLVRARVQGDT